MQEPLDPDRRFGLIWAVPLPHGGGVVLAFVDQASALSDLLGHYGDGPRPRCGE